MASQPTEGRRVSIRAHWTRIAPWFVAVSALIILMGSGILAIHFSTHIDVNLLLSDPAEVAHLPGYTGIYTYVGAFALLTGGAIAFFAAMLLRGRPDVGPTVPFLVSLGVLLAWLGLDDLFMFHEWAGLAIAEHVGRADEPGARSQLEGVVFGAYAVIWLAWIGWYWRTIRETAFMLLLLTLASFGISVVIDVGMFVFPSLVPDTAWMPTTLAVTEEMLKLTGIFFAFAYVWDTSMRAVRRVIDGTGCRV